MVVVVHDQINNRGMYVSGGSYRNNAAAKFATLRVAGDTLSAF